MPAPEEVAAMTQRHARGWGAKRSAQKLGFDRKTAKRPPRQGSWQPRRRPRRAEALDGLEDRLAERFRRHRGNADVIRQELADEHRITPACAPSSARSRGCAASG